MPCVGKNTTKLKRVDTSVAGMVLTHLRQCFFYIETSPTGVNMIE